MYRHSKSNSSIHRKINHALSVVVSLYAGYILLLPVFPHVSLWWKNVHDDTGGFVYQSRLVEAEPVPVDSGEEPPKQPERAPIPEDNRLVLPTIHLDEALVEGTAASTVHLGAWRKPNSSTPDQGGNTVIVGHRFTYSDPAVFYHLDKIEIGEKFPLYWEGEEYNYEVTEVKVVNPDQIEIENQTEDARLTIYTCTPVWTSSQRLVVVAKLIAGPDDVMQEIGAL